MKRYTTPLLGSNFGMTVRMEGPQAPLAVFHPASELERIRNPFLPPDGTPQETVEAEFANSCSDGDGRLSDVWSNDAASLRRVPATPTSGRMIAGSLLVFAVLGAGAFAALYSAVHSGDSANRARYDADESQVMVAPANAALPGVPAIPTEPSAAPAPSNAALETVGAAAKVDSGAVTASATTGVMTTTPVAPIQPAGTVVALAPAAAPPKFDRAPVRKAPIVVHVEPAPVPTHRPIEDKDVPISEDALLASSAQAAQAVPPSTESNSPSPEAAVAPNAAVHVPAASASPAPTVPTANATPTPPAETENAAPPTAPSSIAPAAPIAPAPSAKVDPVPGNGENPDDPRN